MGLSRWCRGKGLEMYVEEGKEEGSELEETRR
jgi:hypothetical protein